MQILIVAGYRRLSRIREDCHSSLTQLDEVRISAEVYGILPPSAGKDVESTFILHPFPSIPAFLV
jgi:hypothetical protein